VLDPLDWLDVAAFCLSRVSGDDPAHAEAGKQLDQWLADGHASWRQPVRTGRQILDAAKAQANGRPLALAALERAGQALVTRGSAGWELSEDWTATTMMRWRLPLGTIQASALASGPIGVGLPVHPHVNIEDPLARCLRVDGVTDLHVHVGATVPFDILFALVVDAALDEVGDVGDAPQEDFTDSVGSEFPPTLAITTAALLAWALERYERSSSASLEDTAAGIFAPGLPAALVAGQVWSFLSQSDPDALLPSARYLSPTRLIAGDAASHPRPRIAEGDPGNLFGEVVARKARWLALAGQRPECAAAVEEILRCETVVYHALTQGPRGGLPEFLLRSGRLKALRDRAAPRRKIVDQGLRHLARGVKLVHAELRTAEDGPGGERDVITAMAASLDQQFRGYEDHVAATSADRRPGVSWPVCLIKPSTRLARSVQPTDTPGVAQSLSVESGHPPMRFALGRLWTAVGAATKLLLVDHQARKLCPGFDVAGDEASLPSWCFALMFQESMKLLSYSDSPEGQLPVTFRVHAGESYSSPLEGLRRVDEAVTHVVPPGRRPRIGHALVLHMPKWDLEQLKHQALDEAFDDLVWAWQTLESGPTPLERGLVQHLELAIREIGREIYPDAHAQMRVADDYRRGYRARFDSASAREVGLILESVTTAPDSWPRLAQSLVPGADVRQEHSLMKSYLTDASLYRAVGTPLVDSAKLRLAFELIQPRVVARMRERATVVEACPTSNLVIAGVQGYAEHPMLSLIQQGIAVTINTDDPGLFGTTIRDEYALMVPALARDYPDAKARFDRLNAIRALGCELVESPRDSDAALEIIASVRARWQAAGLIARESHATLDSSLEDA
jgi:Adenosine deaminase